jgi:hypothetical protein
MTYKDMLLVRSKSCEDGELQRAAMDHLEFRNHEALRAWRVRRVTAGMHKASRVSPGWLPAWMHRNFQRGT